MANRFKLDWIRAQYAGRIDATLEKLYGQPVQLELALAQRDSARPGLTSAPIASGESAAAPSPAELADAATPRRRLSATG